MESLNKNISKTVEIVDETHVVYGANFGDQQSEACSSEPDLDNFSNEDVEEEEKIIEVNRVHQEPMILEIAESKENLDSTGILAGEAKINSQPRNLKNRYNWQEIKETASFIDNNHVLNNHLPHNNEQKCRNIDADLINNPTPYKFFCLFFTQILWDLLVFETNRYAEQTIVKEEISESSRAKRWKPVDEKKMRKYIGLILWMGIHTNKVMSGTFTFLTNSNLLR